MRRTVILVMVALAATLLLAVEGGRDFNSIKDSLKAHAGKGYGGRNAPFKEMMWAEISQIRFGGQPLPRFEDILALMRDGQKSFVEVKEAAGTEIVPMIRGGLPTRRTR